MREGEPGDYFLLLTSGEVDVEIRGRHVAVAGPGAVVGELAVVSGHPRSATVTARTEVSALAGDAEAFEALLAVPGEYERLVKLVSLRLAEDVRPVPATLPDGTAVRLRPLVPNDRAAYTDAVRGLSPTSLHRRFFTGGQPSQGTIDRLLEVSYTEHFALVAVADHAGEPLGVGRFIRLRRDPTTADLAFGIRDAHQGRGIGTLLLGALGAAAPAAGVRTFTADVLHENAAMRRVLDKAGARFRREEPGVVHTAFPADAAAALLEPALASAVEEAAHDIVTAAGLALIGP